MIKSLLLVRHAQAEPYSPAIKDEERELTGSGVADASRMGKHLQSLQVAPDLIIASPAYRTNITAQLLAEQLGYDLSKIVTEPTLYETSMRNLISVINQLEEKNAQIMIIAHNPTLTYLAEYLTHTEIGSLPTCGSVHIQFENLPWKEVSGNTGKLIFFEYPGK